jgi:periplasmic protein CpxP/Spy
MRNSFASFALGSVLIAGLSGSALLAQDQSAAPAGTVQAPAATPGQQPMHVPNPQHQAKKMAKQLNLTPDQQAKIEPILADRDQQMQSVRSDTTLSPQDRRVKVRGIRHDSDTRIEALLNDTQKQQYEQLKQSRRASRQQQGAAPSNS